MRHVYELSEQSSYAEKIWVQHRSLEIVNVRLLLKTVNIMHQSINFQA